MHNFDRKCQCCLKTESEISGKETINFHIHVNEKPHNIYVSQQCFLSVLLGFAFDLKPLPNLTLFWKSFWVCWETMRNRREGNSSSPAMICISDLCVGSFQTRVRTYKMCDNLLSFTGPGLHTSQNNNFPRSWSAPKHISLVFNLVSVLHIASIFMLIHIFSVLLLAMAVLTGWGTPPPAE